MCFLSISLAIKKIKLNGCRWSRFLCQYKCTVFVTIILKGTCWCWWWSSWVFNPWSSLQCVLAYSISTQLLVRVWWVTCNFSAKSSKVSLGKLFWWFCPMSAFLKLALSCLSWGEGGYLSGIPQQAHVFMCLRADPPDLLLQMLEEEQKILVNKQRLFI